MALFKWNRDNPKDDLVKVEKTEFDKEKNLQDLLQAKPEAIEPEMFIVRAEHTYWEDSGRRIDLLGLDRKRNIVVVELKRDKGQFMDLQAIRYAALVSTMTFKDLVEVHSVFLSEHEKEAAEGAKAQEALITKSEESLLEFLNEGLDDKEKIKSADKVEISSTPRIILVAQEFPIELTTAVLWLNDQGLDIKCMQVIPYKLGEESLIDISQVIPLKEAADYQVKKAEKERERTEQKKGQTRGPDTHLILREVGIIKEGTRIKLLRMKREENINLEDPKRYATFTGDRGQVTWEKDNKLYNSLNNLCEHMRDNYSFPFLSSAISPYTHWALEGENQSLSKKAEPYRSEDSDA